MNPKFKNFAVLFVLFVLPLIFYVLVSSGVNNFARLPVLTAHISPVQTLDSTSTLQFENNITMVCFLGNNPEQNTGGIFNLNQKIYKPFYGFKDFQIIVVAPLGSEAVVANIKTSLGAFTNMHKWHFVYADTPAIDAFYKSFQSPIPFDAYGYNSHAFIVDKDSSLRGRTDDEDTADGLLFGYNMHAVATLNNKMKDDVKVLLAEYRLALKKNNADREI